jgi:hypothetical protein
MVKKVGTLVTSSRSLKYGSQTMAAANLEDEFTVQARTDNYFLSDQYVTTSLFYIDVPLHTLESRASSRKAAATPNGPSLPRLLAPNSPSSTTIHSRFSSKPHSIPQAHDLPSRQPITNKRTTRFGKPLSQSLNPPFNPKWRKATTRAQTPCGNCVSTSSS